MTQGFPAYLSYLALTMNTSIEKQNKQDTQPR